MFGAELLRPALHGALGPLDEILTLLPLVIGTALLLYLYFSARKPKASAAEGAALNGERPDDPADL